MSRRRDTSYLNRNDRLIRRVAIRRLLQGAYHRDGYRTVDQIRQALHERMGIIAARDVVATDLREMGAVKVRDEERPEVTWYVVPAYNPNVEDLRERMDAELVEQEVAYKLARHVVDLTPLGNEVLVMTEPRAGSLVGYWLSWLAWPEILLVQEQLDSCVVKCVNDAAAISVAVRLLGDRRLEDAGSTETD